MIVTTKEQSDRLLKCGISEDTADIIRVNKESPVLVISDYKDGKSFYSQNISPAWSSSALMELLPKNMDGFVCTLQYNVWTEDFSIVDDGSYMLDGDLCIKNNGTNWIVDYEFGFYGNLPQSSNLIEAIILAIELLHANGYKFDYE